MQALKKITVLVVLAGLVLSAGCASQEKPENPNVPINSALAAARARNWEAAPLYVVEPPDRLLVTVKDNPDLRSETVVRPDGRVSVELIGDVYVAGKTVSQIEKDIEARFSKYIRNVNVTVAVVGFESKHVFVYGEVENPGQYPYTGRDTVVGVIAQAGTLNWRAAPNGIQVTRGDPNNPTILPVRLKDIVIDDDDITNYYLEANDIIWVPPTTMVKMGDVMREVFFPIQFLTAPFSAWVGYKALVDE